MMKRLLIPCLASVMIACGSNNDNTKKEVVSPETTKTELKEKKPSGIGTITEDALNCEIMEPMKYPANSPVAKWGKLKVAPNEMGVRCLCDEKGNPVQLKGMSSHGLQWAGVAQITEDNIKALRQDWNCSVFRLVIYVDEEGGYAYNKTHRTRHLENVVKWCGEQGMYVLVDWHVHKPGNPEAKQYRKHPSNGVDLAGDFFAYCARRFQNQKHVLYELCNEPNPNNGATTWPAHIKPYCEDMMKIIRSYDKDVVCICGTPNWSQDAHVVIGNEPQDENGNVYENLMYSYHFYAASHHDGNDPQSPYKSHDYMTPMREGDSTAHMPCILATLPIFVTEFGTTDASGWTNFRPDLTDKWMKILDGGNLGHQKVSWCNWSFSAEGGESAALKWNEGNIRQCDRNKILTESGKYIFKKLHEK